MLIYDDLLKDENFKIAAENDKLCLFLGAGVAYNLGMPSWKGLAENIVKFCFEKQIIKFSLRNQLLKESDYIKVISFCEYEIIAKDKNAEFREFLKNIFYYNPLEEYKNKRSEIYKCLIDIAKETKTLIIQTNYDSVIEEFIESDSRKPFIPFGMDFSKTIAKTPHEYIFYLHGKINDKFSYEDTILTRKQYDSVYVLESEEASKKQKQFLKHILENYYVLFLGYSLSDIEILQIIANKPILESYKGLGVIVDYYEQKRYEIEVLSKYLNGNYKINVYTYDLEKNGYDEFKNLLNNLKDYLIEKYKLSVKKDTFLYKPIDSSEVDFNE
jgi:hypothetical protein